jgi:hypothetical protein
MNSPSSKPAAHSTRKSAPSTSSAHAPLPLIHRDLALHRTASFATNAAQLRWLVSAFRIGLVLLVVEVGAWLVALTQRT